MTKPRIEEMVEELRNVFLDVVPRGHQVKDEEVETAAFLFERKLTQALTQAHQAGYADGYKQGKFDAEVTAEYGEPEALQNKKVV